MYRDINGRVDERVDEHPNGHLDGHLDEYLDELLDDHLDKRDESPASIGNTTGNITGNMTHTVSGAESARGTRQAAKTQTKVAYIMSRFPRITETFVLYEMLALQEQGIRVEVYPLQRERTQTMHAEAAPFVARARFQPFMSWLTLRDQFHYLSRKPAVYLATLWTLIRANWGSMRYLAGALAFFPKAVHFARMMEIEGVNHIHAHFASHPAAVAYVIHALTGIPYSFTAHGSDLHRDRHMLCEKVAAAAFVVPISEYNKQIVVDTCGVQAAEKSIVIHCGVDTQVFRPRSQPTPYEQGRAPFTILCIGTLHEVKGQTYLIEACRLLREADLDFVCRFVADGPDLEKLQQQVARAGLQKHVHFHGRLTRNEIAALLRDADVMVTPSVPSSDGRREGIPVVLMEAMASEVPVIASDLSGIPELVEHGKCGWLVAPRDVRGLVSAILQLNEHTALRRKLGQAGRVKVLEEFDIKINAATLAGYFAADHRDQLGHYPSQLQWEPQP